MAKATIIETNRLRLRQWKTADLQAFITMNQDEAVMEFLGGPRKPSVTEQTFDRLREHIDQHSFGFLSAELKETKQWIGFIGLQHVSFNAYFTPAIELGYRIEKKYWNQGLATEGAAACCIFAENNLQDHALVSFCYAGNKKSASVMSKVGLTYQGQFDHPLLSQEHPLQKHVLYSNRKDKII
ncbi:MAG: RimJ/RimL family protein N-acetyltransferase [Cyclobacteriaceae bacterium]|jgi:RimJ/RimL family protein N-acetyltransferase